MSKQRMHKVRPFTFTYKKKRKFAQAVSLVMTVMLSVCTFFAVYIGMSGRAVLAAKVEATVEPTAPVDTTESVVPTEEIEVTLSPKPTQEPFVEPEMVMINNNFSRALSSEPVDLGEYITPDKSKPYEWVSGKKKIAVVNSEGVVTVRRKGTTTIKLLQDGEVREEFTVHVTTPRLKKNYVYASKSATDVAVQVKKVNEYSTVEFYSEEQASLQVDKFTGVLTPLKNKTVVVQAYVDGILLPCNVCICTKKVMKALTAAQKAIGKKYSQSKRMKKNFYDCSSLTWRSYKKAGLNMGDTTWALTASAQAKWCKENGRLISKKKMDLNKLKAGDLIFYSSGKNSNYRNITHVSIYTGHNSIIHASSSAGIVKESEIVYFQKIVGIGRPTGKVPVKKKKNPDAEQAEEKNEKQVENEAENIEKNRSFDKKESPKCRVS